MKILKVAFKLISAILLIAISFILTLNIAKFAIYGEYYKIKDNYCINPGLNHGAVPQGIAVDEDRDIVLTTAYMKDKSASRIYLTNSKKSELKNAILDVLKNKNIKDEGLKLQREIQLLRQMGCNPREEYYIKFINQMDFAIEGNDYNDIFKYEIKPVNTNKIEKSGIPLPNPITINTLNSAAIPIDASFVNTSKSLNIDIKVMHEYKNTTSNQQIKGKSPQ